MQWINVLGLHIHGGEHATSLGGSFTKSNRLESSKVDVLTLKWKCPLNISFTILKFPFEYVTKFAVFLFTKLIYLNSVSVKGKLSKRVEWVIHWIRSTQKKRVDYLDQIILKVNKICISLSNVLLWEWESSLSWILNRNWIKGFESSPRYQVVWHFCSKNCAHFWYLSPHLNNLALFFSAQKEPYLFY